MCVPFSFLGKINNQKIDLVSKKSCPFRKALLYYQDGQLTNQQVGEIDRPEFEQTLTMLNN